MNLRLLQEMVKDPYVVITMIKTPNVAVNFSTPAKEEIVITFYPRFELLKFKILKLEFRMIAS